MQLVEALVVPRSGKVSKRAWNSTTSPAGAVHQVRDHFFTDWPYFMAPTPVAVAGRLVAKVLLRGHS